MLTAVVKEKRQIRKPLYDVIKLNELILSILKEENLERYNNAFFIHAAIQSEVSLNTAFQIAYYWREITKTFLFTSIKALGVMAENMSKEKNPHEQALCVLQTAFAVISDDLNNTYSTFQAVAPKGPKGVHYKWWEESILMPLQKLIQLKPKASMGTRRLISEMLKLSSSPMGVAVQLRVVETIAIDIALAFQSIFSKVKKDGQYVFDDKDRLWISTHIQAETIHNQQVSNEIYGMARVATTAEEQAEMLMLTRRYAKAWYQALNDFDTFLSLA